MDDTYEDVTVGSTREFGRYEVTEAEILEFARQYDPQPFHTDPEAAEGSWFGGLVASGWHTSAVTMRMLVEGYLSESGAMGAIGVDELRWRNPVRPGAVLHLETEVEDKEPWQPGVGLVHSRVRTITEDDVEVLSMVGLVLFERREVEDGGSDAGGDGSGS
jgi:acyl dehydratase